MYFVLKTLPEGATIADFRGHTYQTLGRLKPEDLPNADTINARDFLRNLIDAFRRILNCQSKTQLVETLESVASEADDRADMVMIDPEQFSLSCGVRDNTYQLIGLLQK